MKPFEYASPNSLDGAVGLLSAKWGESEILAGGTDLITSLKQHTVAPGRLVSLKNVPGMKGVAVEGGQVRIGAMTTLAELAEHDGVRRRMPSLVTAIEEIGSPQIISMGTVGGDLCQRPRCWYYRQGFGLLAQHEGKSLIPGGDNRYHAIFGNKGPAYFVNPSSLAPPLIAFDASVEITGPGGRSRQVKLIDFYRAPTSADQREYDLKPNEVLTAVTFAAQRAANATYEIRQREGLDWPLVTASVLFASGDAASGAKVVLGHVAPTPWVSKKAAAVLEGRKVTAELAAEAGRAAADGATPLSRNAYKVQLVQTAVKRAAMAAAGVS